MKKLNKVSATAATLALLFAATPAVADEFINIDGVNPANGVFWQIDQYGIAYGGDEDDNFDHIYYPNEIYGGGDYFYCEDPADIEITEESNGDITVDCPAQVDVVQSGITSTMHFRFYAESPTGYLSRQWIEIENTTDSPITLNSDLYLYYYWNYEQWDEGDNYVTSQGNDHAVAGDTWSAGSDLVGTEIATTSAWAGSCFQEDFTPDAGYYYPQATNTIPANSTTHLISFFNMVFPTEATEEAAAAAYQQAIAQADEYDQFSGRLVAGLPSNTEFVAWTGADCEADALADTGVASESIGFVALGAGSLFAIGGFIAYSRRRSIRA